MTANGRLVTLYPASGEVFGGCPRSQAWTINVDGTGYRPVSTYCVDGQFRRLWLSEYFAPKVVDGMTVTVSYNKNHAAASGHGSNLYRWYSGANQGDIASFTDLPASNLTPKPTGATVNGNMLTVTFPDALHADATPSGSDFRVKTLHWGGPGIPSCSGYCTLAVTAVSVSGATATLTLEESIPSHAVTNLRWHGHNIELANLTPDTAPVVVSAELRHDRLEPVSRVRLWFNEPLDVGSRPPASAFTVTVQPKDGSARTVAATGTVV
ncbi:MAG: SwmB domain-containing protein, partial [Chloroflexi bacterium]|nr:SwmB domain-containing protein [Chloroflexota bacterium]